MKKYKVIDDRNRYRNDPNCKVKQDTEKVFYFQKTETDDKGNKTEKMIILNPKHFQEERIVDEKEAVVLMLKGVEVEEIVEK